MSGRGPSKVPEIYITCDEITKSAMSEPMKELVSNACYQVFLREEAKRIKESWDYPVRSHSLRGWREEREPRVYMPDVVVLCKRIAELEHDRDEAIKELKRTKWQIARTLEDLDK